MDQEEMMNKLKQSRENINKKAMENIEKAQKRQQKKTAYDKRHNIESQEFEIGDKVLLKNFRRKKGLGTINQLHVRYNGPYKISKYTHHRNYIMKDENDKEIGPQKH